MKLCMLFQIIFSIIFLLGSIGNSSAEMGGRGQGFRPCPYVPYQCRVDDTHQMQEVNGKITKVLTETLEDNMQPGMAVVMEIDGQNLIHVHLGPTSYLEGQHFELKPEDTIEAKGVMCYSEGKTRLIAYELIQGDHRLSLRDELGRPNWEAWRKH